jgi:tetratricopeptide (TPR) repeat protein
MAHRYSEAEKELREGLLYDADNARLRNNLLIALAWQGRYDDAASVGRISLEEWIAYNNVGYIAQLKGDYDVAIRLYNAALSSSPRYYPTAAANLNAVMALKEKSKKRRAARAIR